jgi:bacillaene synthase trans-acting acyltransferase/trans-AT polyketide synthase/acyltransferase/oxidoreductase domain-containing protein
MCRELFETEPVFRAEMLRCGEITSRMLPEQLVDVIYGSRPSEEFSDTRYSSFAILALEWSLSCLLASQGIRPDATLGYSLGECAAAAVTGSLTLADAFTLVDKQTQLLRAHCRHGSLIGIIAEASVLAEVLENFPGCHVAAINSPEHITLAGSREYVRQMHQSFWHRREIMSEVLAVEYAYHTQDMDAMQGEFVDFLNSFPLGIPPKPLFSCTTCSELTHQTSRHFWNVVRQPVFFHKTVQTLESRGNFTYVDVGPRGTLGALMKRNGIIGRASQAYTAISPFGGNRRTLDQLQAALR